MTKSELRSLLEVEREHHDRADDSFARGIAAGIRITLTVCDYLELAPVMHARHEDGTLVLKREGTNG